MKDSASCSKWLSDIGVDTALATLTIEVLDVATFMHIFEEIVRHEWECACSLVAVDAIFLTQDGKVIIVEYTQDLAVGSSVIHKVVLADIAVVNVMLP